MQFVVKGKGNAAQYGGPCGDLYVQVLQIENDKFFRKGADIYIKLNISFPEAALGTEKIIDTLYGKLKIKIKAGTQSGTYLKIPNKGMKDVNGYGYGNLYVYIQAKQLRCLMSCYIMQKKRKKLMNTILMVASVAFILSQKMKIRDYCVVYIMQHQLMI
jgi:DnaJ-class molecular chaperone